MDWSIVHSLNTFLFRHEGIEDPLLWYAGAAEVLFLGMLVGVCVLARHRRWRDLRRAAVAAGLSAGLGLLVGKVITEFWDRARPFVAHPNAVHLFARHGADAGFPSDHLTAAGAITAAVLLRGRRSWGFGLLVASVVLAFARVAVGYHYPTDVLGGAAIGALAALVLWHPRLRRRVDALADRCGGLWDRALDAVLGRLTPGRSASGRA